MIEEKEEENASGEAQTEGGHEQVESRQHAGGDVGNAGEGKGEEVYDRSTVSVETKREGTANTDARK
ncbi:hypothetical protein PR001_g17852 [Phytophthora rubi]|nr:hypothetical protein PR002_g18198 [Phytophthora rubi]KAE9003907.1 hypothetical protein PR001_g17852 [Phytophthora rubi]